MYKNLEISCSRWWLLKQLSSNRLLCRFITSNDIGRSMIEMLGVLAIIAVLSVGGIA